MTGYCPLCKSLIMTLTVVPEASRNTAAVYGAAELLAETKKHWLECHTPDKPGRGFIVDGEAARPPWLECETAAMYGNALAWANAVEVAASDLRSFVFALFWMRQELFSVGFDPLKNAMGQRPVDDRARLAPDLANKSDLEPLVVQGRIEVLERLLAGFPSSRDDLAKLLELEMDQYRFLTSPDGPASGELRRGGKAS